MLSTLIQTAARAGYRATHPEQGTEELTTSERARLDDYMTRWDEEEASKRARTLRIVCAVLLAGAVLALILFGVAR